MIELHSKYVDLRIMFPIGATSIRETNYRHESCLIVLNQVYLYDVGPKLVKDYAALILKITS